MKITRPALLLFFTGMQLVFSVASAAAEVPDSVPDKASAEYSVVNASAEKSAEAAEVFAFQNSPDVPGLVTLSENGNPVWSFQTTQRTHEWVAENDARRTAGGYFHPLFGFHGEILTTNASTHDNHQHHHGLWTSFFTFDVENEDGTSTHYDTWTDDTAVKKDLISFKTAIGTPAARGCDSAGTVSAAALLNAVYGLYLRENGGKGTLLMEETLECVTYPEEKHPELGRARAMDLTYTWKNVSGRKITLAGDRANGKNFCALAVRFVTPTEKTLITGPNGPIEGDPLRCDVPWAEYTTAFPAPNGQKSRLGLAIFSDPRNPKDGSGMAIRHYGMLVTGWPGVEGVTLADGESRTLKYRVWLHAEAPWENVQKEYEAWTQSLPRP